MFFFGNNAADIVRHEALFASSAHLAEQQAILTHATSSFAYNAWVAHQTSLAGFQHLHDIAHQALHYADLERSFWYLVLTEDEITAYFKECFRSWKNSSKCSAELFRLRLRLIFKKQQQIKDAIKSIFVPVKIILDSIHPNKIAA